MIELKFLVDEDFTRKDLIKVLHINDYIYAIDEIKLLLRSILKYEEMDGKPIPPEQGYYEIVDKINEKVFEICKELPEE